MPGHEKWQLSHGLGTRAGSVGTYALHIKRLDNARIAAALLFEFFAGRELGPTELEELMSGDELQACDPVGGTWSEHAGQGRSAVSSVCINSMKATWPLMLLTVRSCGLFPAGANSSVWCPALSRPTQTSYAAVRAALHQCFTAVFLVVELWRGGASLRNACACTSLQDNPVLAHIGLVSELGSSTQNRNKDRVGQSRAGCVGGEGTVGIRVQGSGEGAALVHEGQVFRKDGGWLRRRLK